MSTNDAVNEIEVDCVSAQSGQLIRDKRLVVREEPLTVEIKDVVTFTIMCTPCDQMALALGFAFTEGLIDKRDDIDILAKCPDDPNVIQIQLAADKKTGDKRRNLLIVSSCGICGSEEIDKIIDTLPVVGNTLRMKMSDLVGMPQQLRERQEIFQQTGGTHAVGLVRRGEMVAVGEDVGRHSAFDKAIGSCLLRDIPTTATAAVLSGRVSFEMVTKAARAGVELIAAVSAPTSLAIKAAQKSNITLCGFVRGVKATVYCHGHRIGNL